MLILWSFIICVGKSQGNRKLLKKMLSELPDIPDSVIYRFRINKNEDQNLGIKIVGGHDHLLRGVFIKSITEGSICHKDGNLRMG